LKTARPLRCVAGRRGRLQMTVGDVVSEAGCHCRVCSCSVDVDDVVDIVDKPQISHRAGPLRPPS